MMRRNSLRHTMSSAEHRPDQGTAVHGLDDTKDRDDKGEGKGKTEGESADSDKPEPVYPHDAWQLLQSFLTPTRRDKMLAVASARTERIRLVVQDIHDPHNVSACLRSADAFGVQHCDVVTLKERFHASTVARGVASWLTIKRHHSIAACVQSLRQAGYHIYAGVPPAPGVLTLAELPIQHKIAVVFGNEHAGIDKAWLPHIDQPFTIPMVGMVESLNISVGAAITLQYLTDKARRQATVAPYPLDEAARIQLLNVWICRQLAAWPQMLERLRAGQDVENSDAKR